VNSEDNEQDPELVDIEQLSDLGTGLRVITITYDSDPEIFPEVHLGDCSPWVALTILKLAMESIEILLPPINVSYKGDMILQHSNFEDEQDQEDL
jgi:hypothetical protein